MVEVSTQQHGNRNDTTSHIAMDDAWPEDRGNDLMQDPTDVSGVADPTLVDPTITDPTVTDELRTRRVQVKLTSKRLISDKGLPWVLKNGPKRIRISRRKRSVYDNLEHILQFYQLWAHELYPKAKFKDFTKLCQTLGKNDKLLRQFREEVFRKEMMGDMPASPVESEPVEASRLQDDVQAPAHEESEDELYSVSTRQHEPADQTMQEDEIRQELQDLDTQPNDDFFEEDEEAMEAMKEMGF